VYLLYLGFDGYLLGWGEQPPIGLIVDQRFVHVDLGLGRLRSRHLRHWKRLQVCLTITPNIMIDHDLIN
jgi:hypothetical protein